MAEAHPARWHRVPRWAAPPGLADPPAPARPRAVPGAAAGAAGPVSRPVSGTVSGTVGGRMELLRALGAVASSPPAALRPGGGGSRAAAAPAGAEHTGVFVLAAPPHAAIHLGADGELGGDALDRVAGFWRVLGLAPPASADHLGVLLMLYAELGDAESRARDERAAGSLRRAREALLWEHLWSWAPGYLTAVGRLDTPSLGGWARLTLRALAREARLAAAPAALPLALRTAPPALETPGGQFLRPLLAPVRSGIVLTRADLRDAAAAAGAGVPGRRAPLHPAGDARPGCGRHPGLAERVRPPLGVLAHRPAAGRRAGPPALVGEPGGGHLACPARATKAACRRRLELSRGSRSARGAMSGTCR